LDALAAAEREAGIEQDPLRRLVSLLPRDPMVAGDVAARLKLSNRAKKRVACAAGTEVAADPRATAYRTGIDCAVDRLLLAGRTDEAITISRWTPPKLPVSGGALIKRGLMEGPAVSRTLRSIEDRWIATGFPCGAELDSIVSEALANAR
jgi:poly(A) polymerase